MADDPRRRAVLSNMRRRYVEHQVAFFGALLVGLFVGSEIFHVPIRLVLPAVAGIIVVAFIFGLIRASAMLSWSAQGLTPEDSAARSSQTIDKRLIAVNVAFGIVGGFLLA